MFNMSKCKKGDKLITRSCEPVIFKRKIKHPKRFIEGQELPALEYVCSVLKSGYEITFTKNGNYFREEVETSWDIMGYYNTENFNNLAKQKLHKIVEEFDKALVNLRNLETSFLMSQEGLKSKKPAKKGSK